MGQAGRGGSSQRLCAHTFGLRRWVRGIREPAEATAWYYDDHRVGRVGLMVGRLDLQHSSYLPLGSSRSGISGAHSVAPQDDRNCGVNSHRSLLQWMLMSPEAGPASARGADTTTVPGMGEWFSDLIHWPNVHQRNLAAVRLVTHGNAQVSVVSVPGPAGTDEIVGVVVRATELAPTLVELREYCRGKIAEDKMPTRLHVAGNLPRTMLEEVDEAALRGQSEEMG